MNREIDNLTSKQLNSSQNTSTPLPTAFWANLTSLPYSNLTPIAFMGNKEGINLDELEKVINRAVKKALDKRERRNKDEPLD